MKRLLCLVVMMLMLAACDDQDDKDKRATLPAPPVTVDTTLEIPGIPQEIRATLEESYEALRQRQTAIEEVWARLQRDDTVGCDEALPEMHSPQIYAGDDAVSERLFDAAVHIANAYQLWEAECQNPRTQPPGTVIDEGLREALSAGDDLREAQSILQG